ncbi:hydrolase [Parvularcula sp. IMCC14364]|uniref:hydrolase n=1 Tax=Parvularcula sp. IMCC14364 TaxID=3067902 RepID=UPI0027404885|nr:hydrolase [Parvularcula sp. IMCC14364]
MSDLKTHLAALDTATDRMVARTMEWCAINSGTNNIDGIHKSAAQIMPAFEAIGLTCEEQAPAPVTHVSDSGDVIEIPRAGAYVLSNRPQANRRILLTGHLDTVFPKDHHFQKIVNRGDGTLHGPGCADMKGGICVMLEAITAFEKTPYAEHVGIDVIFNADEETGSHASAHVLADKAKSADIGLVFEPALPDGTLAGARAGSGHYTFTVKGLAAHAGREFDKGRNAIVGAANVIAAVNALNGQRENTTMNIGVINGGVATNVVPDTCVIRMNARGRSPEDLRWVDEQMQQIVSGQNFGPDIEVSLHGGIHRPVKTNTGGTLALFELVKAAGADLGLNIGWQATGGCCDGNNLADAGLPNVDTLGVRGGHIHSDKEFAVIESFTERAKLACLVMLMLASGACPWPERLKGN